VSVIYSFVFLTFVWNLAFIIIFMPYMARISCSKNVICFSYFLIIVVKTLSVVMLLFTVNVAFAPTEVSLC